MWKWVHLLIGSHKTGRNGFGFLTIFCANNSINGGSCKNNGTEIHVIHEIHRYDVKHVEQV